MIEPRIKSVVAHLRAIREKISAEDQELTATQREERIKGAVEGNRLLAQLLARARLPEAQFAATPGRHPTSGASVTESTPSH